jgi:hypothetical protein
MARYIKASDGTADLRCRPAVDGLLALPATVHSVQQQRSGGTSMAIIDQTAVTARPRGRTKRRLLQTVIAAAAVFGAVLVTAGPAAAIQTCTGRPEANLCFAIDGRPDGRFNVHVGIDVHMPLAEAQEYVDDAGNPLSAFVRGDDNASPFLFTVPITALGASAESGLSADFDITVPGSFLNEDNGTDEVRAVVTLVDTDTNTVRGTFLSNIIVGNWP